VLTLLLDAYVRHAGFFPAAMPRRISHASDTGFSLRYLRTYAAAARSKDRMPV